MTELEIRSVSGEGVQPWLDSLAQLRIEVFREFPYLYDGDLAYERAYLETYARSQRAVFVLALDGEQVHGVSSAIPLCDETEALRAPLAEHGFEVDQIFYFGESVLRKCYRGQGLGHRFFDQREDWARAMGQFRYTAFCAVDRSPDDPRRPPGHRFLDPFWRARGYRQRPQIKAWLPWREIGEAEASLKPLSFWLRSLD